MTPEQLDEIEQRADCAYGTPKLPIEVLRDLYPLVAEVRRLRSLTQQLLTDLKTATDSQYSRNLVIMRLRQTLGENDE